MGSKDKKESPVELLFQHNLEVDLRLSISEMINHVADPEILKKFSAQQREELSEKVIKIIEEAFPVIMKTIRQMTKESLEAYKQNDEVQKLLKQDYGPFELN